MDTETTTRLVFRVIDDNTGENKSFTVTNPLDESTPGIWDRIDEFVGKLPLAYRNDTSYTLRDAYFLETVKRPVSRT